MKPLFIDPNQIRQRVVKHSLGLNVNFLADHAEMRAHGQGYLAALQQMGVRSLRYPGGEKSNEYFWSQPPWTSPHPTLSLTGRDSRLVTKSKLVSENGEFYVKPMDFDEFIALCRALDAEPIVCIGLGSAYVQTQPGRLVGSTRAQVLENAIEWVRYANQVRGYGVKYWEIGNESYWRGSIATLSAADYTRDILELSRAMKAIDPEILIGANGHVDKNYISTADTADGPIWWQYLLTHASLEIDFLVVHPYPCFEWGGYTYYSEHTPVFTKAVEQAAASLKEWANPEDADRIRIMITETNTFDWAATEWYEGNGAGWPWRNDLGHALVLFDLLGQHLMHPRVDGIQVWNSRWFGPECKLDDVLDGQNALLPTGQAIGLWGKHLQTHLQAIPGQPAGPVYASYNPETNALTFFLMNKLTIQQPLTIDLSNYGQRWRASSIVFAGQDPDDEHPTITSGLVWETASSDIHLTLPPVSITVITCEAYK
jgi:alpha-L-arabinofuranosidase